VIDNMLLKTDSSKISESQDYRIKSNEQEQLSSSGPIMVSF